MVDTDACTKTCKNAKCGDAVVQMGVEECDDGNKSNAPSPHTPDRRPLRFLALIGVWRGFGVPRPRPSEHAQVLATVRSARSWQLAGNRSARCPTVPGVASVATDRRSRPSRS